MVCHSSAKIRHRRSKAYVKVKKICLCVILSKKSIRMVCHSPAKIRRRRSKAYVKVKNLSLCHSVQKENEYNSSISN